MTKEPTEEAVDANSGRQQKLPLTWGEQKPPQAQQEMLPLLAAEPAPAQSQEAPAASPAGPEQPPASTPAPPATAAEALPPAKPASIPGPVVETPKPVRVVELGQVKMSIGQTLQEARGGRNLSVAQVAQKTKIAKHFIEFLETDRLDRMPPAIYSRAYITQLCREYDIEHAPLLAEYERLTAERGGGGGGQEAAKAVVEKARTPTIEKPKVLVDESAVAPEPAVQYKLANEPGSVAAAPKAMSRTVAIVVGVVLVLVLAGALVQKLRPAKPLAPESRPGKGTPTLVPSGNVSLEGFVVPQQLPLKELPIPEK